MWVQFGINSKTKCTNFLFFLSVSFFFFSSKDENDKEYLPELKEEAAAASENKARFSSRKEKNETRSKYYFQL